MEEDEAGAPCAADSLPGSAGKGMESPLAAPGPGRPVLAPGRQGLRPPREGEGPGAAP